MSGDASAAGGVAVGQDEMSRAVAPSPGDLEYELKFGLTDRSVVAVRQWLQTICMVDPAFPTGRVCSIYFDTPALHHLHENANSDYLKTKVRLRWYEQTATADDRAFLEAKFRFGPRRDKVRLEVPHTGREVAALPLHAAELRVLPRRLRAVGVLTPSELRPVVLVRYTRDRFIEPLSRTRISLDTEISAPASNREVLPAWDSRPLATTVIEVKGSANVLPRSLRPLFALGGRRMSFSKYAECYSRAAGAGLGWVDSR